MESLPDEVIVLILKEYLYPSEVLTCRSVCKRFKFLVDHLINFKELTILSDLPSLPWGLRLWRSNAVDRPVKNIIRLHELYGKTKFFPDSRFKIPFSASLKVLQVGVELELSEFMIYALNDLDELEKLVLMGLKFSAKFKHPWLSLQMLKMLSIADLSKKNQSKLFVTSQIETLFCSQLHLIELNRPEYLTRLETWSPLTTTDLSSFKNLRTLKYVASSESNRNILESLKHLEEIHLRFQLSNTIFDVLSGLIDHLMNQKSVLGRPNVRIYLLDISLIKPYKEYCHGLG